MDDRQLDLTEEQEAIKSKYPPINKKYECKCEFTINTLAILPQLLFTHENCDRNSFTVSDFSYNRAQIKLSSLLKLIYAIHIIVLKMILSAQLF